MPLKASCRANLIPTTYPQSLQIPHSSSSRSNLRYEHVCQAQETGKHIREMWHKTDLYAEEFKPDSIKMPFRPWIFENDAEKVAIEKVWISLISFSPRCLPPMPFSGMTYFPIDSPDHFPESCHLSNTYVL